MKWVIEKKAQHFGIRTESVGKKTPICSPFSRGFLDLPGRAYSSPAAALSLLTPFSEMFFPTGLFWLNC
jgi:hypothetical protein